MQYLSYDLKTTVDPAIGELDGRFYASCKAFARSDTADHWFYLHQDGYWKGSAIEEGSTAYFNTKEEAETALADALGRIDVRLIIAAGQVAQSRREKAVFHRSRLHPRHRSAGVMRA